MQGVGGVEPRKGREALERFYRVSGGPLRVTVWLKYADHSITREAVRLLSEHVEPGTPAKR